jgi:erythromycin esterase-like protein
MLSKLSVPVGSSKLDTLLAVAARSLSVQVGYMDGDSDALYDDRRDSGMAQLASFVIGQTHAPRACLWAHNDHIGRRLGGSQTMGHRLMSSLSGRYYPVGFFFFEGSSRAWDAAGEIGVISHHLRPPPSFTVESALLEAAGHPDVGWFPIARLPTSLRRWLDTTRYVRELGAVFFGEDRAMILMDISAAFDAVVVIKTIHDSTPTPTGDRRAKKPKVPA